MAGQGLTATTHRYLGSPTTASPALTMVRRFVQGLGGLLTIALAAVLPWAEIDAAGIAVGRFAIPVQALACVGVMLLVGMVFVAHSTWGLVRRLKPITRWLCFGAGVVGLFSITGLEYGYLRTGGLSPYEYRSAVRMLGYTIGILLLACSVPEGAGFNVAQWIKSHRPGRRGVWFAAGFCVLASALIGRLVMDGMPHIIDGTTYLLEARTLWSGRPTLDPPMHPALFASELLEFRTSDAGYYGKYPVGWPLVLGFCDLLSVPWLAAPLLSGALVGLTYFTVRQRSDERLAAASAVAVGLCPWLWMNAATMMSHVAAAVWLFAFLGLMLGGIKREHRGWLLASGIALGLSVLTRPADAAFFALPAAGYGLAKLFQSPKLWIGRIPLIAVGAIPGVLAYFWVGQMRKGSTGSSYGGSHIEALLYKLPASPAHALIWLQESWAGLSNQWLAGAIPAGLLIVCGLFFGRKQTRGQGLMLACSASLLLCYTVFIFGGRAWVGPRWYVPLIPGAAVLIVAGLMAAAQTARIACAEGVLSAGYLRTLAVGVIVTAAVVLPVRLIELRLNPPHGIDGQVHATVTAAGLTHAVVALPADGLVPGTTTPNYKRGIAGIWTMQTPFENSNVIFVSAVDGWEDMARSAWPDRVLYRMNGEADDFTLYPCGTLANQAE